MAQEALYELKVVGGKDAGKVIPLEGTSLTLGRGSGRFEVRSGAIEFEEPSVSRLHAILNWNAEENVYHFSNRSPISPLIANGQAAASGRLLPGMNLKMGQLVLEVVGRQGAVPNVEDANLVSAVPAGSGFLGDDPEVEKGPPPAWLVPRSGSASPPVSRPVVVPIEPEPTPEPEPVKKGRKKKEAEPSRPQPTAAAEPEPPVQATPEPPASEPSASVEAKVPTGTIQVVKGQAKKKNFKVDGPATIGRSPDCTIALSDSRVSRLHCCLELEGTSYVLVHKSGSSTTKVGRTVVKDRQALQDQEEITLADRVVLRWKRD